MSFASLKKNSGAAGLAKISQEIEKLNQQNKRTNTNDDRFWQPTADQSGNGSAVIRFLPFSEGEEEILGVPWVKLFQHAFKGPGGAWYIENSLTTLGQKDPVGEYNNQLWNTGIEANKEQAKKQKRKLVYISNILVIKDPGNPENEGKVKLFKYGKKIFDMLNEQMHPENVDPANPDRQLEPGDDGYKEAYNPFDLWEGANFLLRIREVDGYRNYDKSEFGNKRPAVATGDADLEKIWNQQYKLAEFIAPSNFKTYEQLKERLDKVLSGVNAAPTASAEPSTEPTNSAPEAGAPVSAETAPDLESSDEGSDLSFLQGLVE